MFVSQTVHSTEQSRTPVLLYSDNTHFPDFFFFVFPFCFLNFTLWPQPAVAVSVDTGGSPVRCGSALCRTHWPWAVGRRWAALSGLRTRPGAGWGPRSCGQKLSGPDCNLRRAKRRGGYCQSQSRFRQSVDRTEERGSDVEEKATSSLFNIYTGLMILLK